MPASDGARRLVAQVAADMTPAQRQAFLGAVLGGSGGHFATAPIPAPVVREAPTAVRGFRVRLDLADASPPVWRRLELPDDLTLDRVHTVILPDAVRCRGG
ncbi:plasmid pRiA4b ORF-3 family protein [Occultella kanbiaonis]|uniref:plasmid pRiA4b ORF-3 family protein n=1 Tax=Occultella kanbiaonis TaxID=2675754 RepID=UPI001F41DA57|nr:plasmid pRiA4b ORF-3 family protein [Occultella kanbiaonis]